LWLQSEELSRRLLADDPLDLKTLAPAVFVPFAQIAGVLVPTIAPAQAASPVPSEETEADVQQPATKSTLKKASRKH
jgi:hypothetical protein